MIKDFANRGLIAGGREFNDINPLLAWFHDGQTMCHVVEGRSFAVACDQHFSRLHNWYAYTSGHFMEYAAVL